MEYAARTSFREPGVLVISLQARADRADTRADWYRFQGIETEVSGGFGVLGEGGLG